MDIERGRKIASYAVSLKLALKGFILRAHRPSENVAQRLEWVITKK